MRAGERDGVDYWFVTRGEFERLRDGGGFAEWAEVHGNLYGTSRAEIARLHAAGQDILFDIDIVGAHNLWQQFPAQTRLVFVLPPTWEELVRRLQARGSETAETLQRRLRTARRELQALIESPAPWHVVLNDGLDDAVAAMEALLGPQPPAADAPARQPVVRAFLAAAEADRRAADPVA